MSSPGTPDRTVLVAPERLAGWVDRFASAHGGVTPAADDAGLRLDAADGASALLVDRWGDTGGIPGPSDEDPSPTTHPTADPTADRTADPTAHFVARALRERVVALLLVRRGATAVGVAHGSRLVAHHVETHYVQGRTKAGGWSQQRYARRRANQADKAFADSADDAVRVLLPHLGTVEALVCGGDRAAVDAVLADTRLAPLAALRSRHPVLPVPDPRLAVLQDFATQVRAVPVEVTDPPQPNSVAPPAPAVLG